MIRVPRLVTPEQIFQVVAFILTCNKYFHQSINDIRADQLTILPYTSVLILKSAITLSGVSSTAFEKNAFFESLFPVGCVKHPTKSVEEESRGTRLERFYIFP